MRRITKLANTSASKPFLPFVLSVSCLGSAAVRASDINWGNVNGGTYGVATNWIGGGVPGINDFAAFGRTRDSNQQMAYTVSYSTNPSIQGIIVQSDRVTFDLNGHAHILTSPGIAIRVGTSAVASGRLTIMDGAVATTATAANAYIGTNGVPGSLIITTGGQLLGPVLWVGGGGPGGLTIQGGGDFVGKDMIIGGLAGGAGNASITGASSVAVLDGGLGVGALSSGSLTISSGGRVESTRGVLGQIASVTGTVNLEGAGSSWTSSEDVVVGYFGQGTMNITGGGVLECVGVSLGVNAGSSGTVTVSGIGSQLNNTTDVNVGERANSSLSITDGGYVGTGSMNIARFSGNSTVNVTGGSLEVGYQLTVGGEFGSINGGTGSLFIGPGGFVDAAHVYICPNDTVSLHGGRLEVYWLDRLFDSTGQFLFHSGNLGARFIEFSIVNQGGTLTPGTFGNTVITGSYTQQSGARLEVDVGGTQPLEIDQLLVSGTATLGGTLQLHTINAFVPTPSQTMVILDAAAILGSFDNVANGQRLNTTNGGNSRGSFVVNYGAGSPFDPTQVVLSNFRACPTDFNNDGVVDFFDYLDFVDAFSAETHSADFNGDTSIDLFDYLDFVESFSVGC